MPPLASSVRTRARAHTDTRAVWHSRTRQRRKKYYRRRVIHLKVKAEPGLQSATSRSANSHSPLIKRHSFRADKSTQERHFVVLASARNAQDAAFLLLPIYGLPSFIPFHPSPVSSSASNRGTRACPFETISLHWSIMSLFNPVVMPFVLVMEGKSTSQVDHAMLHLRCSFSQCPRMSLKRDASSHLIPSVAASLRCIVFHSVESTTLTCSNVFL